MMSTELQDQLRSDACIALFSLSRDFSNGYYPNKTPPPIYNQPPVPLLSPTPSSPYMERNAVPNLLLSIKNHNFEAQSSMAIVEDGNRENKREMDSLETRRRSSFLAAKTLESLFYCNMNQGSNQIPKDRALPLPESLVKKPRNVPIATVLASANDESLKLAPIKHLIEVSSSDSDDHDHDHDHDHEHEHEHEHELDHDNKLKEQTTQSKDVDTKTKVSTNSSNFCPDCAETFKTTSQLRRHQKISHKKQLYKCRTCGEFFGSIADRQTHKNNKHFGTIRVQLKNEHFDLFEKGIELTSSRNENGYFKCPADYCTFVTRIPGYWYDHVNSVEHTGVDPQKRKRRKVGN